MTTRLFSSISVKTTRLFQFLILANREGTMNGQKYKLNIYFVYSITQLTCVWRREHNYTINMRMAEGT